MSSITMIPQGIACGLSSRALDASAFFVATAPLNPMHVNSGWLGGVGETGAVSDTYTAKRTITGRLERVLT
jgi:hypothetical protein